MSDFDNMKTWQAMNCIENAVALGYNDLILTSANKNELHALFCKWSAEWEARRVRFNELAKVA